MKEIQSYLRSFESKWSPHRIKIIYLFENKQSSYQMKEIQTYLRLFESKQSPYHIKEIQSFENKQPSHQMKEIESYQDHLKINDHYI